MSAARGISAPFRPRLRPWRLAPDRALASLVAAGDSAAFDEVYRRHHRSIGQFCRSLLLNEQDAQDALQNTMAAALRSLPGDTRAIELRPWLFRVARNECISILRARRPADDLDDETSVSQVVSDEQRVEVAERLRELVADLQSLPERQRSALVMRELSGLEYGEIALALGTSPATAKQAVYEARSGLQVLAEGRAMSCDEIRRQLSDCDGRGRRARGLRAHLRACDACEGFAAAIGQRRADLALLAPPLAAPGAAGLLGMLGFGGGSGAVATGAAVKAAAVVTATITVTFAGGYTNIADKPDRSPVSPLPAAAESTPAREAADARRVSPPAQEKSAAEAPTRKVVHRRSQSPAGLSGSRPQTGRDVPSVVTPAERSPDRAAPSPARAPQRPADVPGPGDRRPGPAAPVAQAPTASPAPGAARPPVATPSPAERPTPPVPVSPAVPPKSAPDPPVAVPSPSVAPLPERSVPVVPDFRP